MITYLAATCAPSGSNGLIRGEALPRSCATTDTIATALTIVFVIIGAVALLFLVIAGLKYITSQGDPAKVTSAKNQIMYTLAGLIIAALAATIVNFILGRIG